MPKVVLDTTVLVSALLNPNPGGASIELLRFAKQGSFELFISDEILEETAEVLKAPRLRKRYAYADEDIVAYCHDLALIGAVVSNVPEVRGSSYAIRMMIWSLPAHSRPTLSTL